MENERSASENTARRLFLRAYQLQQRGAYADAIRLYHESLEHYPTAEAHTFLGWVYATLSRYEEAIEECHHAITLDPTYGNPYNDIGAYFIELGWWAEALPWLERAVAAPRYENRELAHYNLGRVHEHFNRWEQAAQHYRTAITLNSRYHLARHAYRLVLGMMN
jgi:tetratricopeptide (TPR) repeat protein